MVASLAHRHHVGNQVGGPVFILRRAPKGDALLDMRDVRTRGLGALDRRSQR